MLTPTVYIIDDDEELCDSLSYLLASVALPVKTYINPLNFLKEFDPTFRGCLLIDIRMPQISGLELQNRLNALHCTLPIIFMTGHGDVEMAVHAMKNGAFDFITKPFNDQLLLELIHRAITTNTKSPANEPISAYIERMASLTRREREVMAKVVDGKINKIIAQELGISDKTVELHRANIMQKMKVRSIATLVKISTLIN